MNDDLTSRLIMDREKFVATPYWDVNAWRAGYGSDTWTDAQGETHPITPSTIVTQADADRDLARRIPLVQQNIISNVGQQAWDNLNVNQQAAVTDLGYNYGGISALPSLTKAIQSGDPTAISQAIANRAVDNNDLNASRRIQESQLAAAPVPPQDIPAGLAPPLPQARPDTSTLFGNTSLPTAAMYGVSPLVPGQAGKASLPNDFTTGDVGSPIDPQLQSLLAPQAPTSDSIGAGPGSFGAFSSSLAPAPVAPTPAPTPSFLQPVVSSPSPSPSSALMVRLPSGKMIAPGTYPSSNDGSSVTVAAGPDGEAVVTQNNPGFMNVAKMGPDTVAGGYIGNAISSAIPQVQANVGTALDAAGSKIGGAVDTAKANIGGFLGGIGSLFGGGGAVAPPPVVPSPPTTQYTQQQMQVANPAYEAYIKAQNADDIGAGPGSFADLQSSLAALTPPTLPTVAPPKTITVSRPQPVLAPPPPPMATIATGKTVPVGSISQGGVGPDGQPYTYTVQPDGSIVDSNGRVTALPSGPVGVAATAAQNYYKSAASGNLNRGSSNSAGSAIMRGY